MGFYAFVNSESLMALTDINTVRRVRTTKTRDQQRVSVFAKTKPIAKNSSRHQVVHPQRVIPDKPRSDRLKTKPSEMPEDGGYVVFWSFVMLDTSARLAQCVFVSLETLRVPKTKTSDQQRWSVFAKTKPIAKMAADIKLFCQQQVMTDDPRSDGLKTNPTEVPDDGGYVVSWSFVMLDTSARLAQCVFVSLESLRVPTTKTRDQQRWSVFAKAKPIAKMAVHTKMFCSQRVMTDDPRSDGLKTKPTEMPEDGGYGVFSLLSCLIPSCDWLIKRRAGQAPRTKQPGETIRSPIRECSLLSTNPLR